MLPNRGQRVRSFDDSLTIRKRHLLEQRIGASSKKLHNSAKETSTYRDLYDVYGLQR
jgi:hypothetical protein